MKTFAVVIFLSFAQNVIADETVVQEPCYARAESKKVPSVGTGVVGIGFAGLSGWHAVVSKGFFESVFYQIKHDLECAKRSNKWPIMSMEAIKLDLNHAVATSAIALGFGYLSYKSFKVGHKLLKEHDQIGSRWY